MMATTDMIIQAIQIMAYKADKILSVESNNTVNANTKDITMPWIASTASSRCVTSHAQVYPAD